MQIKDYASLAEFRRLPRGGFGKGPFAILIAEDRVELASTLSHLMQLGFRHVFIAAPTGLDISPETEGHAPNTVSIIRAQTRRSDAAASLVNALIPLVPNEWIHYCYNAEYFFYPFCEDRTVGEMAALIAEERRDCALTYVIDLYAQDLNIAPNAVNLDHAMLDSAGYFADARRDETGRAKDRQHDFFGGLRWRFEEHVPKERRRIDRIGFFRAKEGLQMFEDHRLSDEEMNTFACQWHHSITATICSFRVAKALRSNAGSRYDIGDFRWHRSKRFQWSSQQLMDLGLMEPGQWF